MRAVTLNAENRLHVIEVSDPEPGRSGVVVRVAAAGICGSDLHMVQAGILPQGAILGHETAGIVEEVGPDVAGVAPGDPVAIYPLEPCGTCETCAAGASGRCPTAIATTIGLGLRPGGFAELIGAAPSMLRPLPAGLPIEHGALVEPVAVALRGFKRSRFEPGMTVGVVGCGPIGLCAVLVAKALGAAHVWASDTNAFRAELAGRAGADDTGAGTREADLVVECAGARGTLTAATGAARPGGQVLLLAVNMQPDEVYPFSWVVKELEVVASLAHTFDEFDEAARLIASGTIDPAPVITRRVGLDETDEAFFGLLAGAAEGKVLVTP